jgi:hypothetical protein
MMLAEGDVLALDDVVAAVVVVMGLYRLLF